jgi:hypothetical protein
VISMVSNILVNTVTVRCECHTDVRDRAGMVRVYESRRSLPVLAYLILQYKAVTHLIQPTSDRLTSE